MVPTELGRDYPLEASEGDWVALSDAVARVRFEAHRPIPSDDETLTLHTAIVLGIVKGHPLLPLPPEPVAVMERRGFMQSEDGYWPCWDNEQPLPVGTEAMVFMRWDTDLRAFRLGSIADSTLRMAMSSRHCN